MAKRNLSFAGGARPRELRTELARIQASARPRREQLSKLWALARRFPRASPLHARVLRAICRLSTRRH